MAMKSAVIRKNPVGIGKYSVGMKPKIGKGLYITFSSRAQKATSLR
jgi:hypothetical protein